MKRKTDIRTLTELPALTLMPDIATNWILRKSLVKFDNSSMSVTIWDDIHKKVISNFAKDWQTLVYLYTMCEKHLVN